MCQGYFQRPAALVVALTALATLLVAGCGSSEESEAPTGSDAAPSASAFPAADGRTLEQIAADDAVANQDIVAAPAGSVFEPGSNRYGFGLFEIDNTPITDAEVALYASKPDKPAVGPFPAASESLGVDAAFQSVSTSTDPDAAENVYVSEIDFPDKGKYQLMALIRKDDGSFEYAVLGAPADVGRFATVPDVGEMAPDVHTDTAADAGGDIASIDTRQPPTTMHDEDLADVLGKEPVVLLFATPALCQSRVCGPVADITEQVKSERDEDAAFIMQEIFVNNTPPKVRPPVDAFSLPSEPWLFVIDEDGRVSTRIEGAFSEGELQTALDKVAGAEPEPAT